MVRSSRVGGAAGRAERRIGQDQVGHSAWRAPSGDSVSPRSRCSAVDAVQMQVHQQQAEGVLHVLQAVQRLVQLEFLLLRCSAK